MFPGFFIPSINEAEKSMEKGHKIMYNIRKSGTLALGRSHCRDAVPPAQKPHRVFFGLAPHSLYNIHES